MNEANGNKLVSGGTLSSGAALVAGQVGKGLYLQHETSHLDLGFYDSRCFYDPDFCTEGVTFAMWIKIAMYHRRDQGSCWIRAPIISQAKVIYSFYWMCKWVSWLPGLYSKFHIVGIAFFRFFIYI